MLQHSVPTISLFVISLSGSPAFYNLGDHDLSVGFAVCCRWVRACFCVQMVEESKHHVLSNELNVYEMGTRRDFGEGGAQEMKFEAQLLDKPIPSFSLFGNTTDRSEKWWPQDQPRTSLPPPTNTPTVLIFPRTTRASSLSEQQTELPFGIV